MEKAKANQARQRWVRNANGLAAIRRRDEDCAAMWARVAHKRKQLRESEGFPILHSLETSWEILSDHYDGIVKRADEHHVATTPFEAILFHVEMGFYPPPELLLALLESYRTYLAGQGELTIEQMLFGPPIPKGGGHARRRARHARYIHWGVQMCGLMEEGYTRLQAAEVISEQCGGKPEPESIVRLVAQHFPLLNFLSRINKASKMSSR